MVKLQQTRLGLGEALDILESEFKAYDLSEEDRGLVNFFLDRGEFTFQGQYSISDTEALLYETIPLQGPGFSKEDKLKHSIALEIESDLNYMLEKALKRRQLS